MPFPERRWLKVGEVAELLSLHPRTIRRMISRRAIPFFKRPGIGIRIDFLKLEEELERAEIGPQRNLVKRERK